MNSRTLFGRLFTRAEVRRPRSARRWTLQHLEDRVTPVTNTWSAGSDLWSVDANWSLGHIPLGTEDVVIGTNVTVTHAAGSDSVNKLTLSGGGKLVLSGGTITDATTLDAPVADATVTLSGGTLAGATVTAGTTIATTTVGGTLSGVTLAGTLDLTSNYNVRATVTGGLTLSGGTVLLGSTNGYYAVLSFPGTQALGGTGSVVFGNSIYNFLEAGPTAGSALTIGPNVLVHGNSGGIGFHSNWSSQTNVAFNNQGTIQADGAGGTITLNGMNWTNAGTARAAGGNLGLLGSWTNSGTLKSLGDVSAIASPIGATEAGNTVTITTSAAHGFAVGQSVIIAGVGQALYNGTFTILSVPTTTSFTYSSPYVALGDSGGGTATLNSTLVLGGTFATPTLGTVVSTGGAIYLTGTLSNTASTLNLNATTGSWQLLGGTINGGTVATTGGSVLFGTTSGGTLANGVTLNGTLDITSYYNVRTSVTGGLTLVAGSTVLIGGNASQYGTLSFDGGNQTLGGTGTVVFGNSYYNFLQAGPTALSALTIGPGIVVRGHSGGIGFHSGWGGPTNVTFTNQGTIQSDTNTGLFMLNGTAWTNTGTIQAMNGGNLGLYSTVPAAPAWTSNTALSISGGGSMSLHGNNWTTAGITLDASTLNLGDKFTVANMGTLTRTGGTVNITGTLTNTGKTLLLDAASGSWQLVGGTIDGGTIATTGGATLIGTNTFGTLANGVTLSGTLDMSSSNYYARTYVTGGLTLAGGTILIGSSTGYYSVLSFDGGSQTLGGTGEVKFGTSYYNFLQAGPTSGSALTIGPNVLVHGHTGGLGYHIGWGGPIDVTFTNQGTIQADEAGGNVTAMNDTNFAAGTLTGGTWKAVNGTLRLTGGDIKTNAANIVLDGATSHLFSDNASTDALAMLNTNAAAASITLKNGSTLAVNGQFANAGDLTMGAGTTFSVRHQYASSVIAFSSQYSTSVWSAAQALGPPNTPYYGDYSTSWAPSVANGTQEFLTIGFATPDFADGAIIRETVGNGFVTQIDAIDTSNVTHTVWTGVDPSEIGSVVDFSPTWPRTAYQVAALKIYVDTNHNLSTYEEIDSVQLVGSSTGYTQTAGRTTIIAGGSFILPAAANFTQTGGTTTVDGYLTDQAPPTGNALSFDGINDTVQAPDNVSLDVTTAFTLEAWINPTAILGADRAVISKIGGAFGNNGYQFGVTRDSRLFMLFNAQGEPWGSNFLQSAPVQLLNHWNHIAATYDHNTERLYLNGQLIASQVIGPKTVIDSAVPLRISGDSNAAVYFGGRIDEARVWNTARTATDLVTNSGHGLTGNEAGLVGYWRLDEGTGTVAFDATANHNDAVFVAGQEPTWVTSVHGGTVDLQGGILNGTGTVNLNVANAATVATGPGPLVIGGNYSQTSAGALNVTIGGLSASQVGQLQVDGTVNLDGALNVDFANSFFPAVGDSFAVVNKISAGDFGGSIFTGQIEASTLDAAGPTTFHVTYAGGNGNDVTLTAINRAPTLDVIPNPADYAEGAPQTVNLTGISSGNTDVQTLTITATSSDTTIIPDPIVNYTSPNAIGSLSMSPTQLHFGGPITITVTVTDDGGVALGGVKQIVRTFIVNVYHVPPTLPTDPIHMLTPAAVRTKPTVTVPVGTPVANLVTDATNTAGIAITSVDNSKGTWEFSTDGGANWNAIPTVTSTSAFLLTTDATTLVGFLPALKYQGFANLTYQTWDRTDAATPGTLIDPTLNPDAYSSVVDPQHAERAWIAVGKTKPVVSATGATLMATVKEDAKASRTFAVKNLIGIAALESLPATGLGIAVTGLGSATGTWKYKLAKAKKFADFEPNVSPGHALLLRPTDLLQFIPSGNANGAGDLKFKTWVPDAINFGTYVDTAIAAGIGVDSGAATVPIKAVNDAPTLDPLASPSLGSVNPGALPVASTIAALGLVTADVDNANLGIKVLAAKGGTWEYSKDNGATWTKLTKPVFLLSTDQISFAAPVGTLAGTATLSFKAWDGKLLSKLKDDLTVTIL